ncbi:hypothetical protein [Paraflavitalea speifideaquila]|uniref:hypothetical protein n=1 Tax=Paraflavitalea speifideaquila TaxID=3076558 RepID=UPI0028E5F51E|nr:hypothetical protein [Paraflavitalea speifideiaquila]
MKGLPAPVQGSVDHWATADCSKAYEFDGVDPSTGKYRFVDQNKDNNLDEQDLIIRGRCRPGTMAPGRPG